MLIHSLQEFFADYFAVNTDLFTLNLRHCLSPRTDHWREKLNRMCDGILSCCLSMRLKPNVRFARSSDVTMQIAQELTVSSTRSVVYEWLLMSLSDENEIAKIFVQQFEVMKNGII